jgi:hypothetical protein
MLTHSRFFFGHMLILLVAIRAIALPVAHNRRKRFDKLLVTDFLENAGRIFETASSTAAGSELESGNLSIVIAQDGAIRLMMGSDWPLESLQAHHGAKAAYRVTRSGSQVRVDGRSRTGSCRLQSEPPALVARRLLAEPWPRY